MKNKKILKIIVVIIIGILCINIYKLFIKEHQVTYKINKYKIEEKFYINDNHYYDITINNKYTYTIKNNLNKKKKIIKDIKTYKKNNLTCIIPIYKKDIELNVYCLKDKVQVSNYYLIESNNKDFKEIQSKIKKYNIKYPTSKDTKTDYKKIKAYQKNILDNQKYFIWDYRGIYVIDNENITYQKILKNDLYDNIMNCIVDKYYVLFENTSVNGIKNIYYYDINKNKLKTMILKEKISKNSYINGVVDNLIYVTDKEQKKEYIINIKKEKIEEIDNDQTNYIVYRNGKRETLSKSDFFMSEQIFSNYLLIDEKITKSEELKEEYDYYYYIEDNKVYRVMNNNKVLLFEKEDITDWMIKDREIIILAKDTIYSYTDSAGLRKIVESNELQYNYKNIYDMWKK